MSADNSPPTYIRRKWKRDKLVLVGVLSGDSPETLIMCGNINVTIKDNIWWIPGKFFLLAVRVTIS